MAASAIHVSTDFAPLPHAAPFPHAELVEARTAAMPPIITDDVDFPVANS